MKRIEMKTTIASETKKGLERIAKRERLVDHGLPSKCRAIDYLVQQDQAGATNAQSSSNTGV
jgi:hypothetical protein